MWGCSPDPASDTERPREVDRSQGSKEEDREEGKGREEKRRLEEEKGVREKPTGRRGEAGEGENKLSLMIIPFLCFISKTNYYC